MVNLLSIYIFWVISYIFSRIVSHISRLILYLFWTSFWTFLNHFQDNVEPKAQTMGQKSSGRAIMQFTRLTADMLILYSFRAKFGCRTQDQLNCQPLNICSFVTRIEQLINNGFSIEDQRFKINYIRKLQYLQSNKLCCWKCFVNVFPLYSKI